MLSLITISLKEWRKQASMREFLEKLEVYVTIVSGIVVAATNFWNAPDLSLPTMLVRFIVVGLVSYLVGLILKGYIKKYIFPVQEIDYNALLNIPVEGEEGSDLEDGALTSESIGNLDSAQNNLGYGSDNLYSGNDLYSGGDLYSGSDPYSNSNSGLYSGSSDLYSGNSGLYSGSDDIYSGGTSSASSNTTGTSLYSGSDDFYGDDNYDSYSPSASADPKK